MSQVISMTVAMIAPVAWRTGSGERRRPTVITPTIASTHNHAYGTTRYCHAIVAAPIGSHPNGATKPRSHHWNPEATNSVGMPVALWSGVYPVTNAPP